MINHKNSRGGGIERKEVVSSANIESSEPATPSKLSRVLEHRLKDQPRDRKFNLKYFRNLSIDRKYTKRNHYTV